jgi:hypothetical protein
MLIKCPDVWFLKSRIALLGAVLFVTVRSDLTPQLSQCNLQVEGKILHCLRPPKCPDMAQPYGCYQAANETVRCTGRQCLFGNDQPPRCAAYSQSVQESPFVAHLSTQGVLACVLSYSGLSQCSYQLHISVNMNLRTMLKHFLSVLIKIRFLPEYQVQLITQARF